MNFNDLSKSGSTSLVGSLYPPTTLSGDQSTITGFLEGVGIQSFEYVDGEKPYTKITLFKEAEGAEYPKSYSMIQGDFFKSEAQSRTVGSFLMSTFLLFEDVDLKDSKVSFNSTEEFVKVINELFTFPSPMNPAVHAKIVFRQPQGEKANYNLSRNYPMVELISTGKMKFKEGQNGDLINFTKSSPSTDNELGSNNDLDMSAAQDNL